MVELIIEPDYMNDFRISFHINDNGLEYIKQTIHPKYVNEAPEILEKIFYTRDLLKGRAIQLIHKKELGSQYSLSVSQKYPGVDYHRQSFNAMRSKLQKFGWKVLTQEGEDIQIKFYRFVSTINLGGVSDIGPFTPETANKIYTFIITNLYPESHENNAVSVRTEVSASPRVNARNVTRSQLPLLPASKPGSIGGSTRRNRK